MDGLEAECGNGAEDDEEAKEWQRQKLAGEKQHQPPPTAGM